jgi:hypothetical protein
LLRYQVRGEKREPGERVRELKRRRSPSEEVGRRNWKSGRRRKRV